MNRKIVDVRVRSWRATAGNAPSAHGSDAPGTVVIPNPASPRATSCQKKRNADTTLFIVVADAPSDRV